MKKCSEQQKIWEWRSRGRAGWRHGVVGNSIVPESGHASLDRCSNGKRGQDHVKGMDRERGGRGRQPDNDDDMSMWARNQCRGLSMCGDKGCMVNVYIFLLVLLRT